MYGAQAPAGNRSWGGSVRYRTFGAGWVSESKKGAAQTKSPPVRARSSNWIERGTPKPQVGRSNRLGRTRLVLVYESGVYRAPLRVLSSVPGTDGGPFSLCVECHCRRGREMAKKRESGNGCPGLPRESASGGTTTRPKIGSTRANGSSSKNIAVSKPVPPPAPRNQIGSIRRHRRRIGR